MNLQVKELKIGKVSPAVINWNYEEMKASLQLRSCPSDSPIRRATSSIIQARYLPKGFNIKSDLDLSPY